MPRDRDKGRYRDKRSSSHSSSSSVEYKANKSRHKRRSRSRDRSESSSYRRKRSDSKLRRRSYSRSVSRDRHESRHKRRSTSRTKSKRQKYSRSRSRSISHERKVKKHKNRSKSRSRSNSFDIEPRMQRFKVDDTEKKVEKAIKAAEAAGLTMTKIPTYDYKEVPIKEDMPTMHDRNLLDELNSDTFVPKTFTSSRNKKQSIVIDLNAETIRVPEAAHTPKKDDSIINFDEIPSQEELKEMWVKKLYQYRKKMLKGDIT